MDKNVPIKRIELSMNFDHNTYIMSGNNILNYILMELSIRIGYFSFIL